MEQQASPASRYYEVMDIPSQICNTFDTAQLTGLWISILSIYFPPNRYRIAPDFSSDVDPERKVGLRVMDLKDSWPRTVFVLDINFPDLEKEHERKGAPLDVTKPGDKFFERVRGLCTGERMYAAVVRVHEVKFFEYISAMRSSRVRIQESGQQVQSIVGMCGFGGHETYNVSFDKVGVHNILKSIAKDVY